MLIPTLGKLNAKLKHRIKKGLAAVLPVETASAQASSVPNSTSPPQFDRKSVADYYLAGQGIEIGALHNPLQVPATAHVKYVDRITAEELRRHYPELADLPLVEIDILDDGETLNRIADDSQDFVIANHFIEHCQNPIQTLKSIFRVLKPNGVLYMGIPDKRYTFDVHRPITSIEHLLQDYHEGPAWSKEQHFMEYAKHAWMGHTLEDEAVDEPLVMEIASQFMEMDYSIHFHAWTQTEILELLVTLKRTLNVSFEVELFLKRQEEMILVLRKS